MAQDESERNLRDELNEIIGQYLQKNGFNQTNLAYLEECAMQRKSFSSTATDIDNDSDNKCKACKEELFRMYDAGNGTEFFKTLDTAIPGICGVPEFSKLEFSLELHFGVFYLRNSAANQQAESCTPGFKSYLEGRGSLLSREPEYLPYFALPFIQNAPQHPSFADLFKNSWVTNLREQLDVYLSAKLKETFRSRKRDLLDLMEIYKKYLSPNDGQRASDEQVDKMKAQLQSEHQKIVKLQDNYQKLMHITTELLSALETSVKGEDVNLSEVMDTCLHAFPELFNQGSTNGFKEVRANSRNVNVDSDAGNAAESERRHTPLIRSKTHGLLLSTISFQQLKKDLANGAPRLKMFILQALRWRITKSDPGEQRQAVMSTFISNDLMGVRGGEYGDVVIALITTPTIELRQSMARLLNALASLTSGRSYLSHGPNISLAIMDNVRLNKLETTSLDMSIATLQKLSLRRQLQTSMIEHNIIEWLLSLLDEEDSLSDYALEYAVALLMNLCLRTAGKQRCTRNPHIPLKILTNLLGNQNQEIIPYVNGTLYSLLTVSSIKREAQSMGLEDMLHIFLRESHPDMKRQLEFILRQLSAEDPVEDVMSDYEDEDDDDEEQDVLEDELDKDDFVVVLPGELQGEQLLAAYYSVVTNTAKSKVHSQDILFRRPATPTRSPGSTARRNVSPRVMTQQLSELSTDSVDGPSTGIWSVASHPLSPNQAKPGDAFSPTFNVDHYASHVLNEVVGIEKPVAEAVSFPPVLPREPDKFGGSSVNEYVVAFSSRPKIPRSPEHGSKRTHSPSSHSHSMPSRDG